MDWISNLPWAAFAKQKCILLLDCWFNPILYNFFIQIAYLPYSPSKTIVCISVGACVFNILAVLFDCHVMGHFASTLFGPLTQIEGNGNASLCGGWFWQQGFYHKEGSRSVSQTIGIGENMIQITFNRTQTLQKKLDIWITHICLYGISWDLANLLGTWTSLLPPKWWNRCSQNWAPEISA